MTPGPVETLLDAMLATDAPAARKLRSFVGLPGVRRVVRSRVQRVDALPPHDQALQLRQVQRTCGAIADKLEAEGEISVEQLLKVMADTSGEPGEVPRA